MDILKNVINEENSITGTEGYEDFTQIINLGANVLLGIGISIALISAVLSGIKIITSQGDPREFDTGKKAFKYSIVAFLLCASAVMIKNIIIGFFGGDTTVL